MFTGKPGQVCAMQHKQHPLDGPHSLKYKGSLFMSDSRTGSIWGLRWHLILFQLYDSTFGQLLADGGPLRWVHPGDKAHTYKHRFTHPD